MGTCWNWQTGQLEVLVLTACGFESRLAHHLNIEVSHSSDCNGLQNRRLITHVGSSPTASAINNWATVVHSCAARFESSSQSGSTPVAQGAKQQHWLVNHLSRKASN